MTLRPLRAEHDRSSAEVRFDRLYDRYHREVSAYCRRRIGQDQVDDVVAETFLTAWRRIDEVPDDAALSWLYHVAYRIVGHQWRSAARRRRLGERLTSIRRSPTSTPEDDALGNDEVRQVLEAAARLNDGDAEILRLVSWERLTNVEIATVLDIAPNAVNQRLHRARKSLTKEFNRLNGRRTRPTPARKGASS